MKFKFKKRVYDDLILSWLKGGVNVSWLENNQYLVDAAQSLKLEKQIIRIQTNSSLHCA